MIDSSVDWSRCSKISKRDIETVYSKEILDSPRESLGKNTKRTKFGLEFEKEYDIIDEYCKKKKINWLASAWDLKSLSFLSKYNLIIIRLHPQ